MSKHPRGRGQSLDPPTASILEDEPQEAPVEPGVKVMVARAADTVIVQDAPPVVHAKAVVDYHCDDHPEVVWTRIIPRGDPLPQQFCSQCGIPMRGTIIN